MKTKRLLKIIVAICVVFMLIPAGCKKEKADLEHKDRGKQPWVVDIEELTLENDDFRAAVWTGEYLQLTLMSIKPGGEIGLETHPDHDQFLRLEQGKARVLMGKTEDDLTFDKEVSDDWAVFIPAGYWHNLINTGNEDVKLYSIYSPAEHPAGTIHPTFEDSEADHN